MLTPAESAACTCDWPGEAAIPHRPWCEGSSTAADESGLTRSRRAVAAAAGWPWCDEHKRPRWDGSAPCNRLHPKPPTTTYDEDGAPEPPFGGQYR